MQTLSVSIVAKIFSHLLKIIGNGKKTILSLCLKVVVVKKITKITLL